MMEITGGSNIQDQAYIKKTIESQNLNKVGNEALQRAIEVPSDCDEVEQGCTIDTTVVNSVFSKLPLFGCQQKPKPSSGNILFSYPKKKIISTYNL